MWRARKAPERGGGGRDSLRVVKGERTEHARARGAWGSAGLNRDGGEIGILAPQAAAHKQHVRDGQASDPLWSGGEPWAEARGQTAAHEITNAIERINAATVDKGSSRVDMRAPLGGDGSAPRHEYSSPPRHQW